MFVCSTIFTANSMFVFNDMFEFDNRVGLDTRRLRCTSLRGTLALAQGASSSLTGFVWFD